jgi:hypothetical protein
LPANRAAHKNSGDEKIIAGILGAIVFLVVAGFLVFHFAVSVLGWLIIIWVLFPGLILAPLFGLLVWILIASAISESENNQRRIIREELNRQNR